MIVGAQVAIIGTKAAIWAAITDVDNASRIISGIESVEILERPTNGLVGLKWRETRMLFGKPASADKWITGAVENEYYETRSEQQGFVYSSILSIAEVENGISLSSRHESKPQGIVARLMSVPVAALFKGVAKKALLQDLYDIKSAVEQGQPGHSSQSQPNRLFEFRRVHESGGTMAKITGIGGVFLKCRGDRDALAAWYQKHLGLQLESFGGAILRWPDDTAEDRGLTVWHLAGKDSQWFSPSDSSFMINYRVDNLDGMLAQLRAGGVEVIGGPESHENGKFAWIMDPDGNKVELWEPMLWDDRNKGA